MIGQTVNNRYRVETLLGRGGMGAVYRATDTVENQVVALKVLHFYLDSANDSALTRFHREFRVLARLNHTHIVRAYDYGTHEGVPYLVLEFLAGRTLAEALAKGPLSRPQLLQISRQITEALCHLHAQSIVHRDLKPGNLMLLNQNQSLHVKLMDFGLVRLNNLSMQLTQEGVALGTVAYMSPEQAQGISIDFRADLYALGAIMYEMATGQPPFTHQNPAMILMQQLTTAPSTPRHLNPELDESLEQLILKLLAKEPAQRPASTDQVIKQLAHLANESAPAIPAGPAKRTDIIPHVPLIGREEALSQLTRLWTQAQTGQGQVVLLSGVAGAGKTRLAKEIGLQAQLGQGRFLRGKCREHGALPYEPVNEILDQLWPTLPAEVQESLPAEVKWLLPGRFKTGADLANLQPGQEGQAEVRMRLFAGSWELLRQAAQRQPLLITVDNIQWTDPTTLELCSYIARQVAQAPILFILTYRPEEVSPEAPLNTTLSSIAGERSTHPIDLELLTRNQVNNYLKIALGQEQTNQWLVDSFYQATGGNPLFIEETLKALAAEGQIQQLDRSISSHSMPHASVALQLPKTVLALAERRLQLLPAEDRAILTAAAVLGPEFSFALLQVVARVDEDTLLDAIDRLLVDRLIDELPLHNGEDRYRFTQEALRQALLQTISQRRRRRLHGRAGETIQKLYDTGQPRLWPVLAYHYAEAGDARQAIKYFTLSGDGAAKMYANAEAATYYGHALEIATKNPHEPLVDSQQFSHLYTQRGRCLELNSQYQEALDNYKQMHTLAQKQADPALELAALLAQGTLRAMPSPIHDISMAQTQSEQALALSRELGDRKAEARALWNLQLVYKYIHDPQKTIDYGEQSLAIARQLNLQEQMAYTLNDMAWAYLSLNQPDKTESTLQEARHLWRKLGNMPMLADNLFSAASRYALAGETERAMEMIDETLRISESIDNLWNQAHSWSLLSYIYLEQGHYAKAMDAVQKTIRLSEQGNLTHIQQSATADLGWMHGLLGDIGRGLSLSQQAEAKFERVPQPWQVYPGAVTARLHLKNGNLTAAKTALQATMARLESQTDNSFSAVWLALARCELALAEKAYARAGQIADQLANQLTQTKIKVYLADALYLKAQVFLAQDKLVQAHQTLIQAQTVAGEIDSRRMLWPILFALSQIEARQGNSSRAKALHQQAKETINYIANHAPKTMQTSFLDSPPVKKVLEDTLDKPT